MHRYSLIPLVLLAFAFNSCQKEEPREAVTTTTQTVTAATTETVAADTMATAEVLPTETVTTVPTATVTTTVVTSTMKTAQPVTPAVKPAATAPKPAEASPAPAAEPVAKPALPVAKPAEPVAKPAEPAESTAPAKAPATVRNPPKTHTVDHGGVKHASGSDNATQKCGVCHGKDLRGGKVAKASCFECHDKVW